MFNIAYSNQASTFLKKANKILVKRLLDKINKLKEEPISHDTKRVVGTKLFRVRLGAYRVLYEIDYKKDLVGIIKIDKRARIYSLK